MHYTFGAYRLDTERRELYHHGATVPLQPKMYQVLLYLLEHRDRLVSKIELFEHAWAEVYVGDSALSQCIMALRKVLGDTRQTQRVIQTAHRQGYRFVAPVYASEAPVVQPTAPPELPPVPAVLAASLPLSPPEETVVAPSVTIPLAVAPERRQLTVLCCTLSDLEALMALADPEVLYDTLQHWRAASLECIARFAGQVAQQTPEGFVVYFGYPRAHEDDAQRAIRTGLALLQCLDHCQPTASTLQLSVRIGIHTGLVITEPAEGAGVAGGVALGATPLVAAHVCALAPPRSVVISAPTARLVEGLVAWKPLEAQMLPGQTEALPMYEVRGMKPVRSRLAAAAVASLTPFVGREAELAMLRDRWQRAHEGFGQVVLVRGEAGIGKSRLLLEVKGQVDEGPALRLECRCSPYHQNTALYPLVELVQRAALEQAGTGAEVSLKTLERLLGGRAYPYASGVGAADRAPGAL